MRDNSRHVSLFPDRLSVVGIMFTGTVVVQLDHIYTNMKKDFVALVKLG